MSADRSLYKKVTRESVSKMIFNDLRAKILDKSFAVNEKIPTEKELADLYGVSRPSVRSALQLLEALGYITIRVGEGSFVNPADFESLSSQVSTALARDHMLEYIGEFRQKLEAGCLDLIFEKGYCTDAKKLIAYSDEMISVARNINVREYIGLDYGFHLMFVSLTRNELFIFSYRNLEDLFEKSIYDNVEASTDVDPEALLHSAEFHKRFAIAIEEGKYKKAKVFLHQLLTYRNRVSQ